MVNRVMVYNRATEQPCYDRLGDYGGSVGAYVAAKVSSTNIDYYLLDQFLRPLAPKGATVPIVTKNNHAALYSTSLQPGSAGTSYNDVRNIYNSTDFGLAGMEIFSDGSMTPPMAVGTGRLVAGHMMIDSDHGDRSVVFCVSGGVIYAVNRETRLPNTKLGKFNLASVYSDFSSVRVGWSYNATLKKLVGVRAISPDVNNIAFDVLVYSNVDFNDMPSLNAALTGATVKRYSVPNDPNQSSNYGGTTDTWQCVLRPVLTNDGRIWFAYQGNSYYNLRTIILSSDPNSTSATCVFVTNMSGGASIYVNGYFSGARKMQSRDGSTVALFYNSSQYSAGVNCFIIDKKLSFYTAMSASYAYIGNNLLPFGDSGWMLFSYGNGGVNILERFNGSGLGLTTPPNWTPIAYPYNFTAGDWWLGQVADYAMLDGMGI